MFNKPKEIELMNEITNKPIVCPVFDLTEEIKEYVKQFNSDEEFLRKGGLSTEMLDRLAFGFADIDITTLNPNQLSIKWKEDLENVKYEIQKSGLNPKVWASKVDLTEPIDVSYERNKFFIEDGHHRFVAAKVLNKPLNVNLEIKANPITKIAPKLGYDDVMRCIFKQVKGNVFKEDYNTSKTLTVYHGTKPKFVNTIKQEGLIDNRGYNQGWYVVSTDFESALFHSHPDTEGGDVYVIEFKIPVEDNDRWLGYPYLWEGSKMTDNSTWFALMQKLPSNFISKVHKVSYNDFMKQKNNGFKKINETYQLNFIKNLEKAPYLGSRFGQDVEPKGTYVIKKETDFLGKNWVEGNVTLQNPLFINVDENNLVQWKYDLAKQYNAKGQKLTNILLSKGYDGIITRYGNGDTGEIILFNPPKLNETIIDYTKSNNNGYELIYVDANKLLDKLKNDSPEFDITNKDNQIGNRINKAKEFISNYKDDKRPIHPKTGERVDYLGTHSFEPSVVSFDMNGKLGFIDGRHRILAAIESGIDKVGIEVPKDQVGMFSELLTESNSQSSINCYHTSLSDFNNFDSSKIGSMRNLDNMGFFFTKKEEDAKDFGDLIGRKKQQDFYYLYNCSVNINNPYTFKQFQEDFNGEYKTGYDGNLTSTFDLNKEFILDKIKENNHDGLIFGNLVMCLRPNQIKIINKTKIERVIGSMEKYRRQQSLTESNSQLEDTFIKINSPNIKSHIDSVINKYGDKAETMLYIKNGNEEANKPEYSISYLYCKKLISLSKNNLPDKHGKDKEQFELYGGFPLINYLTKELNNKRDVISRSKKTKTMAGFNNQYNKEHQRVGLIKNGKKYVDRNLREHIELIKESETKVNKEASCIVLLNDNKEILLLKRSDKTTWEPGKWSLVGGKIDLGENAEQAAIRECGEETGLTIKGNKLIYCFTMKEDDYEVNFFIGVSEGSDVRLNGEHTEYKWCKPNDIPELETVPNLLGEIKKAFETLETNNQEVVNEDLLTEKLANVDEDVNMLYNKYFKINIDEIERTGIITTNMFKELETSTETLKTEESIKGNEINPCRIIINGFNGRNFYKPMENLISLSINKELVNYCLNKFNGDFQKCAMTFEPEQYITFLKMFSEDKIKGTIHHELAHWLDDTLNNQHLTTRVKQHKKMNTRDLNNTPIEVTKMEIEGQIHNIKQLYNKYKNEWDNVTLTDVFQHIPSLTKILNKLQSKPEIRKQWLKDLVLRMNREGLLGKNMRINNNINETIINEEMSSPSGLALLNPKGTKTFILYNPKLISQGLKDYDGEEVEKGIYGVIELRYNGSYDTYEVERVTANKGFGPIMYLVALQFAGSKGLTPTRIKNQVSDAAKNVWKQFYDGVGASYVKNLDLINAEDGTQNTSHNEEYLNKKYILNKTYADYNKMINVNNKFLQNDRYGENSDQIYHAGESIITNKMREIY